MSGPALLFLIVEGIGLFFLIVYVYYFDKNTDSLILLFPHVLTGICIWTSLYLSLLTKWCFPVSLIICGLDQ